MKFLPMFLLILALFGCGHSSPDNAPVSTSPEPEAGSSPPVVGLSENPFQLCFNEDVCTATAPTIAAATAYSYTEGQGRR